MHLETTTKFHLDLMCTNCLFHLPLLFIIFLLFPCKKLKLFISHKKEDCRRDEAKGSLQIELPIGVHKKQIVNTKEFMINFHALDCSFQIFFFKDLYSNYKSA